MLSHTVPRKLLEHFAYDDPATRSKRLWRYQKGRRPYDRATPKAATRWDGHFADPANATKEAEVEVRLQQEFEEPVNQFIDLMRYQTFAFAPTHIRLLTGYLTILFHRSRARRGASDGQQATMLDALMTLRVDEERLAQIAAKWTMDLISSGLRRMVTKEEVVETIDRNIAAYSTGEMVQSSYVRTMETMMSFVDEGMRNGEWRILRTGPDNPFVIGDAPVVTWERTERNALVFGQGFAKANVEVFLPVFPTACLHVLPAVQRTRLVQPPSTYEVNTAQAAFATEHCFTNVLSMEIDALLQPRFGTVRLGIDGFHLNRDYAEQFFDRLMNQPPYKGPIDHGKS